MFRPRSASITRPQKRRMARLRSTPLFKAASCWPALIAVGSGVLAASVVDRLVVWGKRITAASHTGRRF